MKKLLEDIRSCTICEAFLPHGTRPVLQVDPMARILIAGQAPGRKVHESGLPFDDASGDRLRKWLGIDRTVFYDANRVAIVPMGFCYPGTGKSGDLPPRKECAATWHGQIMARLQDLQLTIVIGQYALAYHLPHAKGTVTEIVSSWKQYWPRVIPLPHPSPRNNLWLRRNPWFESDVIPTLQKRVSNILAAHPPMTVEQSPVTG